MNSARLILPALLLGTACSGPQAVGYGPGVTPESRDAMQRRTPAPRPAAMEALTNTTVEAVFALPLEAVTGWFLALPLEEALPGTEAIPAVRRTVALSGPTWGAVGDRRRVELEDGGHALEQILVADLPARFRYVVWNYTSDAASYVKYGVGEFRFEAAGPRQTKVTWTYGFAPNGWPATWFLGGFVRGDYRDFMQAGLAAMADSARRAAGPARAAR